MILQFQIRNCTMHILDVIGSTYKCKIGIKCSLIDYVKIIDKTHNPNQLGKTIVLCHHFNKTVFDEHYILKL